MRKKVCISSSSAGALTSVTLAARKKHAAKPAAKRRTFVYIMLRQAFQFLCGSKWRPTPNDNSRTSLPLKPQPTTRNRSSFLNDMPYTEAQAKGRNTRGRKWTKENILPAAKQMCRGATSPHTAVAAVALEMRLSSEQQTQTHPRLELAIS